MNVSDAESAPRFDVASLRNVMGHFATGITVVAALSDDGPLGFTCRSFISLSLEPPLIAICPAKTSTIWPKMTAARRFSVNFLAGDQEATCAAFARSGGDKFAAVNWRIGPCGTPIFDGVVASVECQLELVHEAGDHELVLGRVLGLSADDNDPLIFFKSRFTSIKETSSI